MLKRTDKLIISGCDVIIYDIENIRHNVVYAQSPLKMNDPFDSRIGFSSEKVLDEIIRLHFKNSTMENTHKQFILFLLKYNVLEEKMML